MLALANEIKGQYDFKSLPMPIGHFTFKENSKDRNAFLFLQQINETVILDISSQFMMLVNAFSILVVITKYFNAFISIQFYTIPAQIEFY